LKHKFNKEGYGSKMAGAILQEVVPKVGAYKSQKKCDSNTV